MWLVRSYINLYTRMGRELEEWKGFEYELLVIDCLWRKILKAIDLGGSVEDSELVIR